MKFQLLLFLITIFLLPLYQNSFGTLNITLTTNNQSTKVEVFDKNNQTPTIDFITSIVPILTVGLAIITLFLTPLINERFKLRDQYIVPYRKWCANLYGGMHEYKNILCEILNEKKDNNKQIQLSNNYIVMHFWEIHEHISKGHTWLGKIHKDLFNKKNFDNYKNSKEDIYKAFEAFIDHTDRCWHNVEKNYKQIMGLYNQKDFTNALKQATTIYYCNTNLLENMVAIIKKELVENERREYKNPLIKNDNYEFNKDLYCDMRKFLKKRIP